MSDKKTVSKAVCIDRLRKLIDAKSSRQEIASDPIMNCDVSLITKHYNGDRAITIDYLKKYCRYFKVSADYLLGLSESMLSPEDPSRFVTDYTGLNADSVHRLHLLCTDNISEIPVLEIHDSIIHFLNHLIASKSHDALSKVGIYISNSIHCHMIQNAALHEWNDEHFLKMADSMYTEHRLYYFEAVEELKEALKTYDADGERVRGENADKIRDEYISTIDD